MLHRLIVAALFMMFRRRLVGLGRVLMMFSSFLV